MVHTGAFGCWDRRVVDRCLEGGFGLSGLTGRARNVDRSGQVEDEVPASVGLWDNCEAGDLGVGRKSLLAYLCEGHDFDESGIGLVLDVVPDQADVVRCASAHVWTYGKGRFDGGEWPVGAAFGRDAVVTVGVQDVVGPGREKVLGERLWAKEREKGGLTVGLGQRGTREAVLGRW